MTGLAHTPLSRPHEVLVTRRRLATTVRTRRRMLVFAPLRHMDNTVLTAPVIDQHHPDPMKSDQPERKVAGGEQDPSAAADTAHFNAAESRLVTRCLTGEEAACAELFHLYYKQLMPICMRYAKDAEEAKDIMQEGFARIFSKLGSYSGKGHFIGWLKRVMVNTAINHYRSSTEMRSTLRIDDLSQPDVASEDSTRDDAITNLTVNELLALVQGLPPAYRVVFNLRVMEGWTHEEIAKELGISVGTSKSNLSRARAKLMDQVVDRDPSLSFKRTHNEN